MNASHVSQLSRGPVSAALETDVREWVRKHGIVVWLDADNHYTAFVDALVAARTAGQLPYEVRAFHGSFLDLMLALEGVAGGTEKVRLLVHLPGFTEESVKSTPFYDLYAAGVRYRKALPTITSEAAAGHLPPEKIKVFTDRNDLSLDTADAWLADAIAASEGGFAGELRGVSPSGLFDDLISSGRLASQLTGPENDDNRQIVWERMAGILGLPDSWKEKVSTGTEPYADDIAYTGAGWALAVEYVDDLERAPVSSLLASAATLPASVIRTCCDVAAHLRAHRPDFYKMAADLAEAILSDEVAAAKPEDLGRIDTFRFEEDSILQAALEALSRQEWPAALKWATDRVSAEARSFWLSQDGNRLRTWQLIAAAAELGKAVADAGPNIGRVNNLETAINAYADRGAPVDRAHRHLEQKRLQLLDPQMAHFESLRSSLDRMHSIWRTWADAWARDFNAACKDHGFLPPPSEQQRTIFEDVVRPLTQESGKTALFVVDALRFEMAQELAKHLDDVATSLLLKPRLAELPTVTEVGMNALAPVANAGRLVPAVSPTEQGRMIGFSTGEYRVHDPDTRRRAMHARAGGTTCPWLSLDEVLRRDASTLRQTVAKANLLVLHSPEIDAAGEAGAGPASFDVIMQKVRGAWRLLREAGVNKFVITSDHGFLLLDETTVSIQSHGRRCDPKRRYAYSTVAADHPNEVRVAFADLGYEGIDGFVFFPETTAVFDNGRPVSSFVHGGNSLQERVIPVLTVVHQRPPGGYTLRLGITASAGDDVLGCRRMKARITCVDPHAMAGFLPTSLELALRPVDAPDVTLRLAEASGAARVQDGTLTAQLEQDFEVFFRLQGPTATRIQVELFHPTREHPVEPAAPAERFTVDVIQSAIRPTDARGSQPPVPPPARPQSAITDGMFGDRTVEAVFRHIEAYGAATEAEVVQILGSPSAARRFARNFEHHKSICPFPVAIESSGPAKRYVRVGAAS